MSCGDSPKGTTGVPKLQRHVAKLQRYIAKLLRHVGDGHPVPWSRPQLAVQSSRGQHPAWSATLHHRTGLGAGLLQADQRYQRLEVRGQLHTLGTDLLHTQPHHRAGGSGVYTEVPDSVVRAVLVLRNVDDIQHSPSVCWAASPVILNLNLHSIGHLIFECLMEDRLQPRY